MQTMGRALVAMQTGSGKMKQSVWHTSEEGEKEGMRDGKDKEDHSPSLPWSLSFSFCVTKIDGKCPVADWKEKRGEDRRAQGERECNVMKKLYLFLHLSWDWMMTGKRKVAVEERWKERDLKQAEPCGEHLEGRWGRYNVQKEKASAVSSYWFEGQNDGHDEGLGEWNRERERRSNRWKHAEKELRLKGTAGYQPGRERCRDAGRCDMVTFASTNGLSGFSRAVWCDAPRLWAKNALSSTRANEWPCFDFYHYTPSPW